MSEYSAKACDLTPVPVDALRGTARITVGDAVVLCRRIDVADGENTRRAERRTVLSILAEEFGDGVELAHEPSGKPYLKHSPGALAPAHTLPHISISHCRSIAVVAYDAAQPIGVDAEQWRCALSRVSRRFLARAEAAMFTTDRQLLAAWCVKEAVYKASDSSNPDLAAISIARDMLTATDAVGRCYALRHFAVGDVHLALAMPM